MLGLGINIFGNRHKKRIIPSPDIQTLFGTIIPEDEIALDKVNKRSCLVHGSVIYSGYVYGVPRASANGLIPHNNNAICKIKIDDYSDYTAKCLINENGDDLYNCGQVVVCGNYLYVSSNNPDASRSGVAKINPTTLDHTTLDNRLIQTDGMASDGTYLYTSLGAIVSKVNPNTMSVVNVTIPDTSFNDQVDMGGGVYSSSLFGLHSFGSGQSAHAIIVDSDYIYVNCLVAYILQEGNTNGSQPAYYLTSSRIHKIRKSDMSYIGYALVAQVTDDMDQDSQYIYLGHEPLGTICYGYSWGQSAVRKSDLAVFKLPRLGIEDTPETTSYGVLVTQGKLINIKTNNHLYVIDVTDPSQWTIESEISNFVIYDYIVGPGISSTWPHNEILVDSNGKFHEFIWTIPSCLKRILIPGISFTSTPVINATTATELATNSAILNGHIVTAGGKNITENGFVIGTTSGIYGAPIPTTLAINDDFSYSASELLESQTYYYKAYAINELGTTYSTEMSFKTLAFVLPETLVASYSESNNSAYDVSFAYGDSSIGQGFLGNGSKLSSCKFYIGAYYIIPLTGNAIAKLYAQDTGTFGSTGKPGMSAIPLATSDLVDVSTLPGWPNRVLTTFTFDGSFTLENGTPYFICIERIGGDDSHQIDIGVDTSAPTADGNSVTTEAKLHWAPLETMDVCFYVYGR
jgi:hypothetical protein